ncbi:probable RTX [Vibrio variabilis]|uniref:Probable RTX n=1 Tax=Vibrio variabilis TaxID=990271 RepID=A0ABQ0JP17_9VIBR|nr:probable RTX [Vibrio variabilis]
MDNPDDTFTVQNDVQGTYGTFSIESDGKWTFTASESYDYLNVGQSVSETFQVTTIDGTPTSVTVKIEGTNDAAQVSVGSVTTDETDAALTITDSLTSSDVDNPNNAFTPSNEMHIRKFLDSCRWCLDLYRQPVVRLSKCWRKHQ